MCKSYKISKRTYCNVHKSGVCTQKYGANVKNVLTIYDCNAKMNPETAVASVQMHNFEIAWLQTATKEEYNENKSCAFLGENRKKQKAA